MRSPRYATLILLVLILLLAHSTVLGDKLPVPIPPIPLKDNTQLAVVGWNGTHEVLILTTVVSVYMPRTERIPLRKTYLMELLPFKSIPKAERASERIFWMLGRYFTKFRFFTPIPIKEARYKGVEIIWERKVGAHQIALVEADSSEDLVKWAIEYAREYGVPPPSSTQLEEYIRIFDDYMKRGYKYVAVDIVEVKAYSILIEPIKYIFKSTCAYYPLKVSNAYRGKAHVRIYLIVKDELDLEPVINMGFREIGRVELRYHEILRIDGDLANLFGENDKVKVILIEYKGDSKFNMDIELRGPSKEKYYLALIAFLVPILLIIVPLVLHRREKIEKA